MPLLHGDIAQNVPKILISGRERIVRRTKIRPRIVRCKVLFFYVGGWWIVPYTG